MKLLLRLVCFIFCLGIITPNFSFAKEESSRANFPGGDTALYVYINSSNTYGCYITPNGDMELNYKIKIDKSGNLTSIEIINNINSGFEKEVFNILKEMPQWTPAKEHGQFVDSEYELHLHFCLDRMISEEDKALFVDNEDYSFPHKETEFISESENDTSQLSAQNNLVRHKSFEEIIKKLPIGAQRFLKTLYYIILYITSLAPVFIILLIFLITRKFKNEPILFLIYLFAAGCFAIVPAIFIEQIMCTEITETTSIWRILFDCFISIGFTEELMKLIGIMSIAYYSRHFIIPYKGIIYSLIVSLGFAAVENILYAHNHGLLVALQRFTSAVPAHATFGIIMGYFIGKAKFYNNQIKYILIGFSGAVIFHGLYDFVLFQNKSIALKFTYLLVLALAITLAVIGSKRMRRLNFSNEKITGKYLLYLASERIRKEKKTN